MPKVLRPTVTDGRTRVDRFLDRVKNHPAAAVIIIGCLALGAMASLTDSARKLFDVGASLGGSDISGEWKSESAAFTPQGPEFLRLALTEPASGQLVGRVQFGGNSTLPPRSYAVSEGLHEGRTLKLVFVDDDGRRHSLTGELASGSLRLVLHPPGQGAVATVAQRIPQRSQLVAGRMAITYHGQEFPDPRSACTRMLQERDPPQTHAMSEAPDADGNVHCVGRQADGRPGFDMYQNEVRHSLVCPPGSRAALVDGPAPPLGQACECDGARTASGATCG